MIYVAVGAALLIVGGIAGLVGPKVGTAIAAILGLGWVGLLAWLGFTGSLDGPTVQPLAASLVVGLLAFLIGSNITGRFSPKRESHQQ